MYHYYLVSPKNRFQELILEAVSTIPEKLFAEESERLEKRLALRKNGKCVAGMKSEDWYNHKLSKKLNH